MSGTALLTLSDTSSLSFFGWINNAVASEVLSINASMSLSVAISYKLPGFSARYESSPKVPGAWRHNIKNFQGSSKKLHKVVPTHVHPHWKSSVLVLVSDKLVV